MFDRVRKAALAALQAQDELLAAWREYSKQPDEVTLSESDAILLQQLVFRRIYPANAFKALVRYSLDDGISALLRRYLGSGVSPDNGFGGFVFDLSTMLTDLVEIGGEAALRHLIDHPGFNRAMLSEPRFIESACEALDMETGDWRAWLGR
jgi:hypothetical protein